MVEVDQRNQAVLAPSVAEHRQQARLITEHVRQPPTGADLHPADRGRPRRVGHAGRCQRRRRAEGRVTLRRGTSEDRQRPQQGHGLPGAGPRRVTDRALAEDRIGVLAGRQSLPPGPQDVRGEYLDLERVGRPYRRSEGAQQLSVDASQAQHATPAAARTGSRALLLAPAADRTHRAGFCHVSQASMTVPPIPVTAAPRKATAVTLRGRTTTAGSTDILLARPLTFS